MYECVMCCCGCGVPGAERTAGGEADADPAEAGAAGPCGGGTRGSGAGAARAPGHTRRVQFQRGAAQGRHTQDPRPDGTKPHTHTHTHTHTRLHVPVDRHMNIKVTYPESNWVFVVWFWCSCSQRERRTSDDSNMFFKHNHLNTQAFLKHIPRVT